MTQAASPPDKRKPVHVPTPSWYTDAARTGRIERFQNATTRRLRSLPAEFRFLAAVRAMPVRTDIGVAASPQLLHVATPTPGRTAAECNRFLYEVPSYAVTGEGAAFFERRRYFACTEAREGCSIFGDGPFHTMNTVLKFGKHRGVALKTVAHTDPRYIQWLRNLADASDNALGAQNAILAKDARRNRKVAWRRLRWRFRLYTALWWACERAALRRDAHKMPDVEGFEKDVGAAMAAGSEQAAA